MLVCISTTFSGGKKRSLEVISCCSNSNSFPCCTSEGHQIQQIAQGAADTVTKSNSTTNQQQTVTCTGNLNNLNITVRKSSTVRKVILLPKASETPALNRCPSKSLSSSYRNHRFNDWGLPARQNFVTNRCQTATWLSHLRTNSRLTDRMTFTAVELAREAGC